MRRKIHALYLCGLLPLAISGLTHAQVDSEAVKKRLDGIVFFENLPLSDQVKNSTKTLLDDNSSWRPKFSRIDLEYKYLGGGWYTGYQHKRSASTPNVIRRRIDALPSGLLYARTIIGDEQREANQAISFAGFLDLKSMLTLSQIYITTSLQIAPIAAKGGGFEYTIDGDMVSPTESKRDRSRKGYCASFKTVLAQEIVPDMAGDALLYRCRDYEDPIKAVTEYAFIADIGLFLQTRYSSIIRTPQSVKYLRAVVIR